MKTQTLECVNLAEIADELIKLHVVNDAETAAKVAVQIAEDSRAGAEAVVQNAESAPGVFVNHVCETIDVTRECRGISPGFDSSETITIRYKVME